MAQRLTSEKVVVAAPMSYAGSAGRIWKMTDTDNQGVKALLIAVAVIVILIAWMAVTAWYLCFGLLLVPYRLIRRGSRKRKVTGLQHRETLDMHHQTLQQQQAITAAQLAMLSQQQIQTQQGFAQQGIAAPPPAPPLAAPPPQPIAPPADE